MKDIRVYLEHWKKSVAARRGPFSTADRKPMMLSDITQNGIKITGIASTNTCVLIFLHFSEFIFGANASNF